MVGSKMPGKQMVKEQMMKTLATSKKDIFEIAKETINAKELGYSVVIPHVCNNVNLFGAGFTEAITKHYPVVKTNYHLLGKSFMLKNPGYVQFIDVDREPKYNRRLIIANMIAQNGVVSKHNPRPLNYAYLVKSMVDVKKYIIKNFNSENKVRIYAPKFGSGLARGNWSFIKCLIEDIWEGIDVTIF